MSKGEFGEMLSIDDFDHAVDNNDDPIYEFYVLDMTQLQKLIECHNALAGIPDPAAFRLVVEELREAAHRLSDVIGMFSDSEAADMVDDDIKDIIYEASLNVSAVLRKLKETSK